MLSAMILTEADAAITHCPDDQRHNTGTCGLRERIKQVPFAWASPQILGTALIRHGYVLDSGPCSGRLSSALL